MMQIKDRNRHNVEALVHPGSMRNVSSYRNTSHDADSLLFGRRKDYHSAIGSIPLHAVDFEAGNWRGNCAGHHSVDWIKGKFHDR
ncbi:hypothetical protein TNCV_4930131 [Trichonephila clavipes]|nr:hypothetical protein TNCV_4930131 [Trichonephila clavipes]